MATVEPSWADTSVRWLRTHHPEYVPASSKRTWAQQLSGALSKMCYHRPAKGTFDADGTRPYEPYEPSAAKLEASGNWTKFEHAQMVTFLTEGGYRGMRGREREANEEVKSPVEAVTVYNADGTIEEVHLEMDAESEGAGHGQARRGKSTPRDAAAELDEIVLEQDPRLGAW